MSNAECFWCLDDIQDPTIAQRCFGRSETSSKCTNKVNPDSETFKVEAKPLDPDTKEDIVQISPQQIKLNLRPEELRGHSFSFSIGQSKQYPLDLYFLLDLSWSMKSSRDNFAEQGEDIIEGIKEITEDLHTGFGSFVEKNVPPFTSSNPAFNCPKENPNCSPPYSFYHRTTLANKKGEQFKEEVLDLPLAGNVDEPEGSLDGLMQAMVCKERVGWRENARKIILLATDRDFHFAMDGKLAGILDRNDATCHLNGSLDSPGFFTHSTLMDYPSVSQIRAVAEKNVFVLIFAVIPRYLDIWKSLSSLIQVQI